MKYMKRAMVWAASNVTFSQTEMSARSYKWWKFVALIEGKVIFNNYFYSSTTCRHQWKVRRLMNELGIRIDETVTTSESLGNYTTLEELYLDSETQLCDAFLNEKLKAQDKYHERKERLKRQSVDEIAHNALKNGDKVYLNQDLTEVEVISKPALQSIDGDAYMSRPSTAKLSLV